MVYMLEEADKAAIVSPQHARTRYDADRVLDAQWFKLEG